MATVTGFTAAHLQSVVDEMIISGAVDLGTGHLILTKHGGGTVDAGNTTGPAGPTGVMDGDIGNTDNILVRSDGTGHHTLQGGLATLSDSGVIGAAQVLLGGNPSNVLHAATKQYVDNHIGCKVLRSATQSIANNTLTPIQFNDTDIRDTSNFHDPASNNTRLVAPLTGWYIASGLIAYDFNASGPRLAQFKINNTTFVSESSFIPANASTSQGTNVLVYNEFFLTAGDYVELLAYQLSGGSLNITRGAATLRFESIT